MSRHPLMIALAALSLAALAGFVQESRPASRPSTPPKDKLVYVMMTTSMGDILLELNNEKAPVTVANFYSYANDGFYDGTVFHRVMSTFMIQGGGMTADLAKKPTKDGIANEWQNGLSNERGSIAMARLGGQADSATSQFFINVVDNPGLDEPRDGAGYAVFGKVAAGMDVVDRIKMVPTHRVGSQGNVPVETVTIERVRPITAAEAKEIIKEAAKGPTSRPAG